MSEIKAQLYAGNPLSIADDELERLSFQSPFGIHAERRTADDISTLFTVFIPSRRIGDEQVLVTNATDASSRLLIDAVKYLHLLPAAIRELREPKDKLATNIVEHIDCLQPLGSDSQKAEIIAMVQDLIEAEQARFRA